MTDYVIDASALVLALADKGDDARDLRSRLPRIRTHAPHLIDAEVGNVLRRQERAGHLSAEEAETAVGLTSAVVDHRYPHGGPLARRAWTLRHNLSFYDALYVALAEYLAIPLLTADERLGRASELPCRTELV